MNSGDVPVKFPVPFGNAAPAPNIRAIPAAASPNPGWASLEEGFPPETMLPLGAGGVPPFGQDFNGLLFQDTAWARWQAAGGPVVYDSAFATASGGYPKGAILMAASLRHQWISTADNNTTDPDAGGAGWRRYGRIKLDATLNLYVSAAGSNSNDGLTVGTPWGDMPYAWSVLQRDYDLAGQTVIVNVANGSYTAGVGGESPLVGQAGPDSVFFRGNVGGPSSVTLTVPAAGVGFNASLQAGFTVEGMKLVAAGAGAIGLAATDGGVIRYGAIEFGAFANGYHIAATGVAIVFPISNYTISGGGITHMSMAGGAVLRWPANPGALTVTLTGTPAFSQGFYTAHTNASSVGPFTSAVTFTGAATGKRYDLALNASVNVSGGGANVFPGNAAGTTASGGQYA